MAKFLGEKLLNQEEVEIFKNFSKSDWAMHFIEKWGQIEGQEHRGWVLDQVARILNGTPIIIKLASWEDGYTEYRVSTSEQVSEEYQKWCISMLGEYDEKQGCYEYFYNEGIAP